MENKNQKLKEIEEEKLDHGKVFAQWTFQEYIEYERKKSWYVIATCIFIAGIFYSLYTFNILFSIFLFLFALIIFLQLRQPPKSIEFKILEHGISVGEKFYEWPQIESFCIVYQPPKIKRLYIGIKGGFTPNFSIPLQDKDPVEIRNILQNYLIEDLERTEEKLTDAFSRWFKI